MNFFSKIKNIIIEKVEKEKILRVIIPPDVKYLLNEGRITYMGQTFTLIDEIKLPAASTTEDLDFSDYLSTSPKFPKYDVDSKIRNLCRQNNYLFNEITKIENAKNSGQLGEDLAASLLTNAENLNDWPKADNFEFADVKSDNTYYSVKLYTKDAEPAVTKRQILSFIYELLSRIEPDLTTYNNTKVGMFFIYIAAKNLSIRVNTKNLDDLVENQILPSFSTHSPTLSSSAERLGFLKKQLKITPKKKDFVNLITTDNIPKFLGKGETVLNIIPYKDDAEKFGKGAKNVGNAKKIGGGIDKKRFGTASGAYQKTAEYASDAAAEFIKSATDKENFQSRVDLVAAFNKINKIARNTFDDNLGAAKNKAAQKNNIDDVIDKLKAKAKEIDNLDNDGTSDDEIQMKAP